MGIKFFDKPSCFKRLVRYKNIPIPHINIDNLRDVTNKIKMIEVINNKYIILYKYLWLLINGICFINSLFIITAHKKKLAVDE